MVTEGKEYFYSFENAGDLIVYILVCVCQFYYWGRPRVVNGYYVPDDDSYFEAFLLPTILFLHLNLIL